MKTLMRLMVCTLLTWMSAAQAGPVLNLNATACNYSGWYGGQDQLKHSVIQQCYFERKLNNPEGQIIYSGATAIMEGKASNTVLKMSAAINTTGFGTAHANGKIQTADYLSVMVDNYLGEVDMTYALFVDAHYDFLAAWEGGAGVDSTGSWQFSHAMDGKNPFHISQTAGAYANYLGGTHESNTTVNGKSGVTPVGYFQFTVRVPANAAFLSQMRLDVAAYGGGGGHSYGTTSANVDLGNSIYWGGVLAVKDLTGKDLAYSVTSASGSNYKTSYIPTPVSVPEPGSLALLFCAAAAGVVVRRRRL